MTDSQDDICDALVGAAISRHWIDGPLHIAARVVEPGFVLSPQSGRRPSQLARVLGWPTLFCEALAAANGVLADPAERRSLAITLFAAIRPGRPGRTLRISPCVTRELAIEAALTAHAIACQPGCTLGDVARQAMSIPSKRQQLVAAMRSGDGVGKCVSLQGGLTRVVPGDRTEFELLHLGTSAPAVNHAYLAIERALNVARHRNGAASRTSTVRQSAIAQAKARGVAGGVACSLAIARALGLVVC